MSASGGEEKVHFSVGKSQKRLCSNYFGKLCGKRLFSCDGDAESAENKV
jgi:hypothetical protein